MQIGNLFGLLRVGKALHNLYASHIIQVFVLQKCIEDRTGPEYWSGKHCIKEEGEAGHVLLDDVRAQAVGAWF